MFEPIHLEDKSASAPNAIRHAIGFGCLVLPFIFLLLFMFSASMGNSQVWRYRLLAAANGGRLSYSRS